MIAFSVAVEHGSGNETNCYIRLSHGRKASVMKLTNCEEASLSPIFAGRLAVIAKRHDRMARLETTEVAPPIVMLAAAVRAPLALPPGGCGCGGSPGRRGAGCLGMICPRYAAQKSPTGKRQYLPCRDQTIAGGVNTNRSRSRSHTRSYSRRVSIPNNCCTPSPLPEVRAHLAS
jgi:hypothetical protein